MLILACGAIAREVLAVIRLNGWENVTVLSIVAVGTPLVTVMLNSSWSDVVVYSSQSKTASDSEAVTVPLSVSSSSTTTEAEPPDGEVITPVELVEGHAGPTDTWAPHVIARLRNGESLGLVQRRGLRALDLQPPRRSHIAGRRVDGIGENLDVGSPVEGQVEAVAQECRA